VKIVDIPSRVLQKYRHKNRADKNQTKSLPDISAFRNKKCCSLSANSDNFKNSTIRLIDSEDENISVILKNTSADVSPYGEDENDIECFVLPESSEYFHISTGGNYHVHMESSQEELCNRPNSSNNILLDPEYLNQEDISCSSCRINFQTVQEKYKHSQEVHVAKFKCTKCGGRRIFNSYLDWKNHLKIKHKIKSKASVICFEAINLRHGHIPRIKLLKCNISKKCVNYFRSRTERDKHIRENHKKGKNFLCDYCEYKAIRKDYIVKHTALVHGTENIKCQLCPKKFKSHYSIKVHLARVHTENVCNFCNRTLTGLWKHRRKIVCKFCNEISLCKGAFQTHLLACSKKPNSQICSNPLLPQKIGWKERARCLYCSKSIVKCNMRLHVRRTHPKLKVRCSYSGCIHFFTTKIQQQKHHEDFHAAEEKLKVNFCTLCSFKTRTTAHLKRHISLRHGSENLKCVVCTKFFKSQMARALHYRIYHKNIQTCMLCKTTVRKMSEHLKTDECTDCSQVFPCKGLFKIHRDNFHKKKTFSSPSSRSMHKILGSSCSTPLNTLVCNLFINGIEEGMEDFQKLQSLTERHLEKNFPLSEWIYVFTIGSPDGCGFGLHCLFFEEAAQTFPGATLVQAQVAAIAKAVEKVAEKEVFPLRKFKFVVFSDSRNAIQMAKSSVSLIKSLVVLQGQGKKLKVQWIPSGCQFIGKDRALFLSRIVSKGPHA